MTPEQFRTYFSTNFTIVTEESAPDGEILRGILKPLASRDSAVAIVGGIPRFVPDDGYGENFGLQWNAFRSTQLDSRSGLSLSASRFWANTRWQPAALSGKTVLEVGCGAGRFTEVLLAAGARVVSCDLSCAVDANFCNNRGKGDLLVMQADLYHLPLPDAHFDYVFCYGVLQHTPNPDAAYREIFRKLKPGGSLSIDYYRKLDFASPWSTPKYFWRPLTSRMSPQLLFQIVRFYVPLYLPIDTAVRSIPRCGNWIAAQIRIPCWNYLRSGLSKKQRREWAVLDTFDALAPRYDFPKTMEEVQRMVASDDNESTDVFFGSNGIVANVVKRGEGSKAEK